MGSRCSVKILTNIAQKLRMETASQVKLPTAHFCASKLTIDPRPGKPDALQLRMVTCIACRLRDCKPKLVQDGMNTFTLYKQLTTYRHGMRGPNSSSAFVEWQRVTEHSYPKSAGSCLQAQSLLLLWGAATSLAKQCA